MSKYVIKNCPACRPYNVFGLNDKPCCYNYMKYCQDINDCLLKKIVEKCREHHTETFANFTLSDILALIDIEECEE